MKQYLLIDHGQRTPTEQVQFYGIAKQLGTTLLAPVRACYLSQSSPEIGLAIRSCIETWATEIVAIPYVWSLQSADYQEIETILRLLAQQYPDTPISLATANDFNRFSGDRMEQLCQMITTTSPMQGSGMDGILPPQYQGSQAVTSTPMGSAEFVYGADGLVAWNQIWEDFCDLALAGGPPHRGVLLVPIAPAEIEKEIHLYGGVVAEIERGIELVTGIVPLKSDNLGWVGIPCTSAEMAIWLMRAIIVENILVRREDSILYLPASPTYTLQGEIKNIITVVAKTFHYWQQHLG